MKKKKSSSWGYNLLKPILSPIYKFYYRPKIINKEYIPETGPVIIVGNHKHMMDQCAIIISTKRIIHYLAKKEYFDGHFAWFFKITGCISVDRSIHDKEASTQALEYLKNNQAIGLFPEGTRNKTNKLLLPFKYGAVAMAKKMNCLIVPFGITGDYHFRTKNLKVEFAKPFKVGNMSLEKANEKLENIIREILVRNGENEQES